MRTEVKVLLAAVAVIATSLAAPSAQGALYTIDSSQSSIEVTGKALNLFPIVAQKVGSNIAILEGSLDISTDGGAVTIHSSVADAVEKPGPFSPGIVSGDDPPVIGPNAPADIALYIGNISTGRLALRDFVVAITGTSSLTDGNFNLSDLLLTVSNGTLDYVVPLTNPDLIGHLEIAGESASPSEGTGTLVGGVLTIPFNVSIEFEILEGEPPGMAVVNLKGQIVANVVPEPGTIAMLGMGAIGLVVVGRRRLRRA